MGQGELVVGVMEVSLSNLNAVKDVCIDDKRSSDGDRAHSFIDNRHLSNRVVGERKVQLVFIPVKFDDTTRNECCLRRNDPGCIW